MSTSDNAQTRRPGGGTLARVDVSELDEHGATTRFEYTDEFGRDAAGVIVNWHGDFVAYRNRCPHWGTELDAGTGEFFDSTGSVLMCQMHGARFDPDSGVCRLGPCEGEHLDSLAVEFDEDDSCVRIKKGASLSL